MKKSDYTGQPLFVGIDVHKKTYSIVVMHERTVIKKMTLKALPGNLLGFFEKYYPRAKIKSAYEAGFSGFGLHRFLEENGVENIVVHAAAVEIGANDRVKNDKRDALKLATQLEAGRLRGIFIPDKEMEDRRELTRLRATLVDERRRTGTRMKHKAHQHGLIGPDCDQRVSKTWIRDLLTKEMGAGLQHSLKTFAKIWTSLSEEIKEVDRLIQEQAEMNTEIQGIYRSTPGVGPTAAAVLSNELGDMQQFSNERELASYLGLTPSEHSSGEHTRRGHITKQGKSYLRAILVQSSWVAIRHDKKLSETFDRIADRQGLKRAIIAIARRLAIQLRACLREKVFYKHEQFAEAA